MFSHVVLSSEPTQLKFYVVKVENVGAWIYDGVSTVCAAFARDERPVLESLCKAFWEHQTATTGYLQVDDSQDAFNALVEGGSTRLSIPISAEGLGLVSQQQAFLLHARVWGVAASHPSAAVSFSCALPPLATLASEQNRSLRIAVCVVDERGRVLTLANKNSDAALRLKWQLLRSCGEYFTAAAFFDRWSELLSHDMQYWRDSEVDGLAAGDASALWIEKSPCSLAAIKESSWFSALRSCAAREQRRRRALPLSAGTFELGSRVGLRWDWPKGRRELVPAPVWTHPAAPPALLDSFGQALLCAALELQQEAGIDIRGVPAEWFRDFTNFRDIRHVAPPAADGEVATAASNTTTLAGSVASSGTATVAPAASAIAAPSLLLPGALPLPLDGRPACDRCDVLVLPVRLGVAACGASSRATIPHASPLADHVSTSACAAAYGGAGSAPIGKPAASDARSQVGRLGHDHDDVTVTPRGEFDLHAWVPLAELAFAAPSLVHLIAGGDAGAFASIVRHASAVHEAAGDVHRLLLVPEDALASHAGEPGGSYASDLVTSAVICTMATPATHSASTSGSSGIHAMDSDCRDDRDEHSHSGLDLQEDAPADVAFLVAVPPATAASVGRV